jgi:16S rRNA processing protein RimM
MTAEPAVTIGRVARPHGLLGEMVVRDTPFKAEEFSQLGTVQLVSPRGELLGAFDVEAVRQFGEALLVRFGGVDDVDRARELRGTQVRVERRTLPATEEDEVYYVDLVGLEVREESGRVLGRIARVLPTGAHEVLEVSGGEGILLVPYHPDVVLGWDRDAGRLSVRLPAGLEEVYRSQEPKKKPTP